VTLTDIATRTYGLGWLDLFEPARHRFGKLLMLQMIRAHPCRCAGDILGHQPHALGPSGRGDRRRNCRQLDFARTLRFSKKELIWLAGNSFWAPADVLARFIALARRFPPAAL
jgi:nicotinate phosphoribosyltransferase